MCGLCGFILHKPGTRFPTRQLADALLCKNEVRGSHATGFMTMGTKGRARSFAFDTKREPLKASEFVKVHQIPTGTRVALLHTRHYTKGKPEDDKNNHPVSYNTCFVTHNGSIKNDDELIEKMGMKETRRGEVDSWAIPAALEHYGWGTGHELSKTLSLLHGPWAIAVADPIKRPNEVLLARGQDSPLHILHTEAGFFWSSEEKHLLDAWGEVVGTPPKNKSARIEDHGIHVLPEGEFLRFIVNPGGRTEVRKGQFSVNRASYGYGAATQNYRAGTYHRHDLDWTCWPSAKDCIFGDDCGTCWSDDCICFVGNPAHPKLNTDITWKEAMKFSNFKYNMEKAGLKEEQVSRTHTVNPTGGGKAVLEILRGSGGQKITSTSTEPSQAGTVVTVSTKCIYCDALNPIVNMKRISATGTTELYECVSCQNKEGMSGPEPIGYPESIEKYVLRIEERCDKYFPILEEAILETAWEFRILPDAVRFIAIGGMAGYAEELEDPVAIEWRKSVQVALRANWSVFAEASKGVV